MHDTNSGTNSSLFTARCLLWLFFLFSSCSVFGLNSKTDSLEKALLTATDSVKVNAFIALANEDLGKTPETASVFAEKALILSRKINFGRGEALALNTLGTIRAQKGDYAYALAQLMLALHLTEQIHEPGVEIKVLNSLGTVQVSMGNYEAALESFLRSEKRCKELGELKSIPLNNIAAVYYFLGKYEKALGAYLGALETYEKAGNKRAMINPLMGVGNVYMNQNNLSKSLEYYRKALQMATEVNSKQGIAKSLNNMGMVFESSQQKDSALVYYIRSLHIKEEIGDKNIIANSLLNIGNIYQEQKKTGKAMEYYNRSYNLCAETGNKNGIAESEINIGHLYSLMKQPEEAVQWINKGLELALQIKRKEIIKEAWYQLSDAYSVNGSYQKALEAYRNYVSEKDSLMNEENSKGMAEVQTKYETAKKEEKIELLTKNKALDEAELNKQKLVRNFFVAGSLFLLLVAFLLYNRYLIKQKANASLAALNSELEKLSAVVRETDNAVIITDAAGNLEWVNPGFRQMTGYTLDEYKSTHGGNLDEISGNPEIRNVIQKSVSENKAITYEAINVKKNGESFWTQSTLTPILDETGQIKKIIIIDTDITQRKHAEDEVKRKNQDITDSINYAKQIQTAILPSRDVIRKHLPDSFILFKPKDIVSGDFYFFSAINDHQVLIAAVDCTGHGVPGAFMSMIGNNLLTEIITGKGITEPDEILNQLDKGVRHALKQNDASTESKDGMDLALCLLDTKTLTLDYAGANRPLFLLRKQELTELKPDKSAIGGFQSDQKRKFTLQHIQLQKEDALYLFSDGYVDQFGGPLAKKFMAKRFRQLLADCHSQQMSAQQELIDQTFLSWKGQNEQVDDILVIGIRV